MHLGALALVLVLLAPPLTAEAQPAGNVARIGVLLLGSVSSEGSNIEAFRQWLRESGWIESKNLIVEYRYADDKQERLAELAAELLRLKVDMITGWGRPVLEEFQKVDTRNVRGGVVVITGPGPLPGLGWKNLEVLKEVLAGVTRLAILTNPTDQLASRLLKEIEFRARALAMQLQVLEVRAPNELDSAFSTVIEGTEALLVLDDPVVFSLRGRIADLAAQNRLPAIYQRREYVEGGGLMACGLSIPGRAAFTVDKILKVLTRTRPAPPAKCELVINLKTARALGVTIPPSLLLRADHVIE